MLVAIDENGLFNVAPPETLLAALPAELYRRNPTRTGTAFRGSGDCCAQPAARLQQPCSHGYKKNTRTLFGSIAIDIESHDVLNLRTIITKNKNTMIIEIRHHHYHHHSLRVGEKCLQTSIGRDDKSRDLRAKALYSCFPPWESPERSNFEGSVLGCINEKLQVM